MIGGLDSETPEGIISLICTDDGILQTDNIDLILNFLTREKYKSKIYFTFNLRFDAQAIIKQLPVNLWLPLWMNKRVDYKGYRITYIPKKLLAIARKSSGNQTKLYDIAQYYHGYSLDKAAKQFLGEQKNDDISAEKIGESRQYYEDNLEKIIEYCKKDAELTMKLGKLTEEKFTKLGANFSNPVSPAGLSAYFVQETYDYPRIIKPIEKLHRFAKHGYRGGWFQTMQRGLFDQPVYDYDINSAYPSAMVTLPHWANGRFIVVNDEDAYKTDYGWVMCEFDCEYIPYNTGEGVFVEYKIEDKPIKMKVRNTKIIYPKGMRKQIVTKLEYDWMKRNGFAPRFILGVYWVGYKRTYVPPFAWMDEFYKKRQSIKKIDFAQQWAMKIFMNGLYGKTAQQRPAETPFTNFFYASYITAITRMKIADVVFKNKDAIINVATDGILSLKPLDVIISDNLGEWGVTEYNKAVVVGNGIIQLFNKDGSYKTKARGITENKNWDLLKALEEHKKDTYLDVTRKAPVQLGEVLHQTNKLKYSDLNVFLPHTKRMDVNCDKSNDWSKDYINFEDLLNNKTIARPRKI